MGHSFLDAIVERGNVSTKQLIDTAIFFTLNLEEITNTGVRILVFFLYLNEPDGARTDHPMNG